MIDRILSYQFSFFKFQFTGKSIIKNPLFSGSAIMIIGSNLSNFIAYIYHLIIGRMLGPSSYGTLAAVLSLLGLVTTVFSFLGVVIVKFVSAAEKEEADSLFKWFKGKINKSGIILFILALLSTPFLSKFLHIDYSILILVAPMFLFSLLLFFYRAFLQGLLRFKDIVISTNLDMFGRLIMGVILIYIGFSAFGAVAGIALSNLVTVLVLRRFLRDYGNKKTVKDFLGGKRIFSYSIPVIVASVTIHSFFSNDLLLVKHFFNAHDAGIFASLSTLGKIIFYGTAPVISVMFPLISKRHSKNQSYHKILFLSIFMTAGISACVTLIYYFLPELMINILYGSQFLGGATYLYLFGIFMTIFSISSLLLNYYLSKEETGIVYVALLAAALQFVGIWLYHDSIYTVAMINIGAVSFLLVSLLIYFIYGRRKSYKK